MKLSIQNDRLRIDLSLWERIWAFFFNQTLEMSLQHIRRVTTDKPAINWRDVRMPGTSVLGVIKAGTYHSDRGREFWFVNRNDQFLTLELEDEFYKRIVLTVEDNLAWAEKIQHYLAPV